MFFMSCIASTQADDALELTSLQVVNLTNLCSLFINKNLHLNENILPASDKWKLSLLKQHESLCNCLALSSTSTSQYELRFRLEIINQTKMIRLASSKIIIA